MSEQKDDFNRARAIELLRAEREQVNLRRQELQGRAKELSGQIRALEDEEMVAKAAAKVQAKLRGRTTRLAVEPAGVNLKPQLG